jgi:hypothetical protein
MKDQTILLAKEWNATIGAMLNAEAVLKNNTVQIQELFDGNTYSRVHRKSNGTLYIEEREKGTMYPRVWELFQDFSELEKEFQKYQTK